jgi:cell division septum initiation protein DivIVA
MREFTSKDFLNHVNQQARQGQFFEKLKEELESKSRLGSQIAGLEREIKSLEGDVDHHKAQAATAAQEATEIIDKANERGGDIISAARVIIDEAESDRVKATMVVESAHVEAREIVAKADAEAKRLMGMIDELRAR